MALAHFLASSVRCGPLARASGGLVGVPALGSQLRSSLGRPAVKALEWPAQIRDDGRGFTIAKGYREAFLRYLGSHKGERIAIVLKAAFRRRSQNQNAYWRGVVVPLFAEKCGYLPHEHNAVHDELMRVLVGLRPDSHPELQIRVSSRDLDTTQFNQLIEAAQIFAAEKLGLVIPDPSLDWKSEREKRRHDTRRNTQDTRELRVATNAEPL